MAPPRNQKPKDPATSKRSRLCCFTCFDMTRDMETIAHSVQYLAYAEETCPTTGRKHFQAFAYAKDAQRFSWWRELLQPMHFELCNGTLQDNAKYCSKEGQLKEYGVKPMGSGHKRVLLEVKERLEAGDRLNTIKRHDAAFDAILRNERGLREYEKFTRMQRALDAGYKRKEVHVYTGPTNTGKSRFAYDTHGYSNVYSMPDNGMRWAGTYDGQPVVLFDDVTTSTIMSITDFLRYTDGYPIEVPVKGGFTPWIPEHIYFTSNKPFDDWWPYADPEHVAAAKRRVTEFRVFAAI